MQRDCETVGRQHPQPADRQHDAEPRRDDPGNGADDQRRRGLAPFREDPIVSIVYPDGLPDNKIFYMEGRGDWFHLENGADLLKTVLSNVVLPATFTHSVGNSYEIAMQAVGTSPTTLRAKIWRTGTAEPNWQLTATDSTAALQRTGSPGVLYYASRSFSGASATLTVDALRVTTP